MQAGLDLEITDHIESNLNKTEGIRIKVEIFYNPH